MEERMEKEAGRAGAAEQTSAGKALVQADEHRIFMRKNYAFFGGASALYALFYTFCQNPGCGEQYDELYIILGKPGIDIPVDSDRNRQGHNYRNPRKKHDIQKQLGSLNQSVFFHGLVSFLFLQSFPAGSSGIYPDRCLRTASHALQSKYHVVH